MEGVRGEGAGGRAKGEGGIRGGREGGSERGKGGVAYVARLNFRILKKTNSHHRNNRKCKETVWRKCQLLRVMYLTCFLLHLEIHLLSSV